jgi:hypothetical protein
MLSLGFIHKVLFLEKPKTTRGKRASSINSPGSLIPWCHSALEYLRKHFMRQFTCSQKSLVTVTFPNRRDGPLERRKEDVPQSSMYKGAMSKAPRKVEEPSLPPLPIPPPPTSLPITLLSQTKYRVTPLYTDNSSCLL